MTIGDLTSKFPAEVKACVRKRPQPAWFDPMLATLVDESFSREGWLFEPKLDGERCLTFFKGRNTRLFSRNKQSLNLKYPELIEPCSRQTADSYIVDGEIVAFKGDVTSFSQLQRRMQVRDAADAKQLGIVVFYYVFDLLYLNGYDLREVPLIYRKAMLKDVFHFRDPLRFTPHIRRDGETYFQQACRKGLEGAIGKREASVYVCRRSRDWLKFKCWAGQEFVIGGFTEPKGERIGLGALLLGYYDGDQLIYAGKVGTGFDTTTLANLGKKLSALQVKNSPFANEPSAGKGVHWVRPELVAQVSFTQWTRDGKLRHPRFLGIRRDKRPREVIREQPQ